MKLTMAERFVNWLVRSSKHWDSSVIQWIPYISGVGTVFLLAVNIWWFRDGRDVVLFMQGVLVGLIPALALLWWERSGWLKLVDTKDAELRQMRESRDELRRQLESLAMDKRGDEQETRFREQ